MENVSIDTPSKECRSLVLNKILTRFIAGMFAMLCASYCLAQNDWASARDWQNILVHHEKGELDDTLYLQKAQALTEKSFKDPSLKQKLSTYRKIAWSDTSYRPFRVKYFAFLANQATQLHQDGFAIYYLQKMEEQLREIKPYVNSLNQPRLLLFIYGNNDYANHNKRITIIDSVMPFLKSLPGKLSTQPVSINTCINAFTILKHASQLYLIRKDTAKVFETVFLSRKIWRELEKIKGVDKGKMVQCRLSLYLIECAGAQILDKKDEQAEMLSNAYKIISSENPHVSSVFRRPFERTILGRLIDFYIDQNQIDSVNHYFSKFKANVLSYKKNESGDGTKFLVYSGKVHAANKDYRAAYQDILRAYELNDSIISIRTADIHNNMYAHLVAEQRNEALIQMEREKGNRNLVIFVITIVLVVAVCVFLWRIQVGAAMAERKIEALNKITQIQIAELEANANKVQKKMGMELHDDIAGKLVNIVNLVEAQTIDEADSDRREKLKIIGKMARNAYTDTRLKSHEWYFGALKDESMAFSGRVAKIVDQALPDGKYEKQIEIDDHSLEQLSPEMRIQLLRCIQEAVANILKHAKAGNVKLFLYEEDGAINLQIADNGSGFDTKTKARGFGLKSLQNRVGEMKGTLVVSSSVDGTELLFNIPTQAKVNA